MEFGLIKPPEGLFFADMPLRGATGEKYRQCQNKNFDRFVFNHKHNQLHLPLLVMHRNNIQINQCYGK